MRFSYSRVSSYAQCPYKYKLRYVDRLRTIPETNADNALFLGQALHKGIERGLTAGLTEYLGHYNVLTDEIENWVIQLSHQIPRVQELLPIRGEHEIEVRTDDFIGYVDYVADNTIYDFKFSNNVEGYTKSPQLSIYKYYLELVRPDLKINSLKFVFVPKILIRQKLKSRPPETIVEFRKRLETLLDSSEIKLVDIPFNMDSVTQFQEACQVLKTTNDFPKNPSRLCDWCEYKRYCQTDGAEDWNII